MKKPKPNGQISECTPMQALDAAVVLLLQSADMIDELLRAPKLAYKPQCKEQISKLRAKAKWLSQFAPRR